ncbi:Re/Si-specific NAD(P)(+) transhydrogenase subunit alpha [Agriterribacter sp.]|uniref:Re/Si-specific NAD(P)(+) transhydrogenase subunit alpha n=1 Tax=Agriterribacter sp. TaxID=2821509 RepID=UPI002B712B88|nr:Re/Si-specific NAD(P)(+) transhydrogenase subunit alpha [Agriterribacter sp.]HRO45216.1 Re/Si-specific NAD(P)(+) transhydrogenase subunit alpha [Agriterribacter sp.]HRQ16819.1 Re/Si-specific NAD(P)(+) transhydrogenase subunit alpha [Agriterribacter sp.]
MIAGILKEPTGENRVSLLPEEAEALAKRNVEVRVESGAGDAAFADEHAYHAKGVSSYARNALLSQCDIILSIHGIVPEEISTIKKGAIVLGVLQPLYAGALMQQYADAGVTVFSMDMLPRTSRAQSMDVLSSQANIAGYKAVLTAANHYGRYFPMFMTAAGSIAPARVLILGAGVAGLQAIATAKRLGAVVEVFDTRPAVKEEVMSLGAKFIEVEGVADASEAGGYAVDQPDEYKLRQQQKIADHIARADIVITTAQIPGKKAPLLITEDMLKTMRNGSVIVDIAAETGGNTPFTKNEETIRYNGVSIIGNSGLPSSMPSDASKLYGRNILNFLYLLIDKEGKLNLSFNDDLVKGTCVVYNGEIVNEKIRNVI